MKKKQKDLLAYIVLAVIGLTVLLVIVNEISQSNKFKSIRRTQARIMIVEDLQDLVDGGLTKDKFDYITKHNDKLKNLKNDFYNNKKEK